MELGIKICVLLTTLLFLAEIIITKEVYYSLFGVIGTLLLLIIELAEVDD